MELFDAISAIRNLQKDCKNKCARRLHAWPHRCHFSGSCGRVLCRSDDSDDLVKVRV